MGRMGISTTRKSTIGGNISRLNEVDKEQSLGDKASLLTEISENEHLRSTGITKDVNT